VGGDVGGIGWGEIPAGPVCPGATKAGGVSCAIGGGGERPGETGDGISPPDGWPGAAKDGGGDDGKAGCPGAIIGGCAG
jgi:hypothetical protein